MESVPDSEIEKALLEFKWSSLVGKSPAFIATVIRKKLRSKGIVFSRDKERVKVRVSCVTEWDKNNPVKHEYQYIYQQWDGWEGELVREGVSFGKAVCRVRFNVKLEKGQDSSFETEILKADLEIIADGKEEKS